MTEVLQAQDQSLGSAAQEVPVLAASDGGPPAGLPPPDPFAEAQAALNQQWALLSQHLQMLNSGTENEMFAAILQKTMEMLNQASMDFSVLHSTMANTVGAHSAAPPRLDPLNPDTLLSTVDSLLENNLGYVNKAQSKAQQGFTTQSIRPNQPFS